MVATELAAAVPGGVIGREESAKGIWVNDEERE
jgi:hypothetical protein